VLWLEMTYLSGPNGRFSVTIRDLQGRTAYTRAYAEATH
jgi:hypothetical protein